MGGPSAEAEVSRNSAAQVSEALQQQGHSAPLIELDANCATNLLKLSPDVVFPALHGPPGEDGTVQGFLELLGFSYVGSDVRGSALAMDKHIAKSIFAEAGLPVATGLRVEAADDLNEMAVHIEETLGDAIVIKPLSQGSAIGVMPLPQGGDVVNALQQALRFGACLVEPFVTGLEITVGVLDTDDGLVPHPVIEIATAAGEWYDYENRYAEGQSQHIIPARLPERVNSALQDIALRAHRALGLRDLSRADFIVGLDDSITLLEVNTLPGMTATSLYPDGARALGFEFDELVSFLAKRAMRRSQ